jgi:tRNA pseudouridine38-40 synthase
MYLALGVEYNGANYSGFQRQNHAVGVQNKLEDALSIVANERIETVCAGRTDAKVHATGQVISFKTNANRLEHAWVLGTNAHLPSDIAITWAKEVDENFHARFSATARRYRYIIHNAKPRMGICSGLITQFHNARLDEGLMHDAAQILIGEHDFSSFRGINCQSHTPMRNVHFIDVSRVGDYVIVDIEANAFLLHMVRNIVGALFDIGTKKRDKDWLKQVFEAKNRQLSSPTAPPDGLYLIDVTYPEEYHLVRRANLGPFLML